MPPTPGCFPLTSSSISCVSTTERVSSFNRLRPEPRRPRPRPIIIIIRICLEPPELVPRSWTYKEPHRESHKLARDPSLSKLPVLSLFFYKFWRGLLVHRPYKGKIRELLGESSRSGELCRGRSKLEGGLRDKLIDRCVGNDGLPLLPLLRTKGETCGPFTRGSIIFARTFLKRILILNPR